MTARGAAVVFLTVGFTVAVAAQRGAAPARGQTAPARGQTQKPAPASGYNGPRTPDRKPDLNGIWQVVSTAHWNVEAHSASEGVPAGFSVVEGGTIPYQPWALPEAERELSEPHDRRSAAEVLHARRAARDVSAVSVRNHADAERTSLIAYEFAHATRTIFLDGTPHMDDLDFWMGDARGKWEGDTLVVDTVSLRRPDLVRSGRQLPQRRAQGRLERFTPIDATHINYEVTIDDAKVFTRPWKMNMMIYRRSRRTSNCSTTSAPSTCTRSCSRNGRRASR